jgi:hypothetical protein
VGVIVDCRKAIDWLEVRMEGEVIEYEDFAKASKDKQYWNGRIAGAKDALKIIRGVKMRLEMEEMNERR